ncbi:MAG: YggS family pyridoxal phosphate-dependent enzyme [Planctomycetota bacterium]|jgi:pyridoxal phosphate enzyme (YggS family)
MAALNSEFEAPLDADRLAKNLQIVRQEMADACKKAGKTPAEVTLVAVTKTVSQQTCNELVRLGCLDLAENRPQVLWEKSASVDPQVRWHFIGHLQRNKSPRTVPLLDTMHALDSLRLAEQMTKDSVPEKNLGGKKLRVLLELNITQDKTKTGLSPTEAQGVLEKYLATPLWQERLDLCGLMGMSSLQGDIAQTRREFESIRLLRDRWQDAYQIRLPELSMGMSDDFQIAIQEGSTMVRIGSRLYR